MVELVKKLFSVRSCVVDRWFDSGFGHFLEEFLQSMLDVMRRRLSSVHDVVGFSFLKLLLEKKKRGHFFSHV